MAEREIERVGVVGTGLIGSSWAVFFLARGLDVIATDPAPGAEVRLRETIAAAWPVLDRMGLAGGASQTRVRFATTVEDCVADADFVQENGPEREDIKRETFRRMDAAAPADVILASSTSGFRPSLLQRDCRHPERVLVGHPFNPPHLVPLVEIVGGEATSEDVIDRATRFYQSLGKTTIRVRKELLGHVANRLQAALWREAMHLIDIGAVTATDVDAAIAHGPGLRWALMGPMLLCHLAGGAGGLRHFLEHFGPLTEAVWAELGQPALTDGLERKLIESVDGELASVDLAAALADRDRLLVDLIAAKAKTRL
jgi:carnitine 3-dehydrogenase